MNVFYRIYYTLVMILVRPFYRIRVEGRENIPDGACLICGNHTSNFDPIAIAIGMGWRFPSKFMAKAELAKIPVLKQLLRPIIVFVRRGKSDLDALRKSISHLKSGGRLVVFPEGTRTVEDDEGEAKTGVVMMAVKSEAVVLPVFITRGKKGPRWHRVDVVFGKPYMITRRREASTSEFYRSEADKLMDRVFALDPQR